MKQLISKSQFKPQVLEYLRQVENSKQSLVITHAGKPVIQVIPYREDKKAKLKTLHGTIINYQDPTKPVNENDWEVLK